VIKVDGEETAFNIQYYSAEDVRPGRYRLGTDRFFEREKRSIDGKWNLTDQEATTYPEHVMCCCWVQDDGTIHAEYKHRLQEAILAHESL
jgi:hypothetical protein